MTLCPEGNAFEIEMAIPPEDLVSCAAASVAMDRTISPAKMPKYATDRAFIALPVPWDHIERMAWDTGLQ
jgi:hypothetical protein